MGTGLAESDSSITVSSKTARLDNRWGFAGQYSARESVVLYNFLRSYNAKIGRYLQSDLSGLNGGINLYGYVGQNPLRNIDPSGRNASALILNLPGGCPRIRDWLTTASSRRLG